MKLQSKVNYRNWTEVKNKTLQPYFLWKLMWLDLQCKWMNENIYLKIFWETFHLEVWCSPCSYPRDEDRGCKHRWKPWRNVFHLSYHHITYCNQERKNRGPIYMGRNMENFESSHTFYVIWTIILFLFMYQMLGWNNTELTHILICTHLNGFRLFRATLESSWQLLLPTAFSQTSEVTLYTGGDINKVDCF